MTDDPTRQIKTEISMRIDGPHSRVGQFRQWFNKNFKDWAKTNDERRAFSPKLRTQNGDLTLTFSVSGSAMGVVTKFAELCEHQFPGLCIEFGSAWERSYWSFGNCDRRDGGPVVTEFAIEIDDPEKDQCWRGRPGAFERVPYDIEDEDEAGITPLVPTVPSTLMVQ